MKWINLVGKTIVAFRGYKVERFGKEEVTLSYVLFDDCKTYLQLREQDKYDYHDCCSSARMIDLQQDAKQWAKMYNEEDGFFESSAETTDPFY